MSAPLGTGHPRVVLVPRPECDSTDLYVVRPSTHGRQAFVVARGEGPPATGWHDVATGCEAHLMARLSGSVGVNLWELDAHLEVVKRALTTEAI
jgi:hypothetical protein